MDPNLKLGPVALRVKDLDLELSFYQNDLGFEIAKRSQVGSLESFELAVANRSEASKQSLLALNHDPDAVRPSPDSAGLFHYAILLPDRPSLASTYLALGNRGVYLEGSADHVVSEALYLHDPEGNGIEIYRDKPREEWHFDSGGHVVMDTLALDLDSLLSELSSKGRSQKEVRPFPSGASIGHVHLQVSNLERSVKFYEETLGFNLMQKMSGAAFLSVSGYHHHVGLNTWHTLGGSSRKKADCGLEYFTLVVSDKVIKSLGETMSERYVLGMKTNELMVSDPDGIEILLKSN